MKIQQCDEVQEIDREHEELWELQANEVCSTIPCIESNLLSSLFKDTDLHHKGDEILQEPPLQVVDV